MGGGCDSVCLIITNKGSLSEQKKKKSTASRNHKVVKGLVNSFALAFSPLGKRRKESLLSLISEAIVPEIEVDVGADRPLKFWCFGGWSFYRAKSILEKEPLTIKWLNEIEQGSVFWDIGANLSSVLTGGRRFYLSTIKFFLRAMTCDSGLLLICCNRLR